MKIIDILKNNDKGVAFEFFPPKSDASREAFGNTTKILKEYKPLYVSMTYGAAGSTQDATKEAVSRLLEEKELTVVPHLTCIGAKIGTIRSLLNEYKDKGVEGIMALRGDIPQDCEDPSLLSKDFVYAKALVKLIKEEYNNFCIGAAVYPEGHIETNSLEEDIEHTKQKVDAGASFAVTQMFFDNTYYYGLLDRMKEKGINIPVLPGILPLTNISKVKKFASICRTTIPKDIENKMQRLESNPADMEKAGIEFTIEQCQDLIKNGAKHLHFFTLNKPNVMKTILDAIK